MRNPCHYFKVSALMLAATSCVLISGKSAQANPFGFIEQFNKTVQDTNQSINKTVNDTKKTVGETKATGENTNNSISNLTNFLSGGKNNNSTSVVTDSSTTSSVNPSSSTTNQEQRSAANDVDSTAQLLTVYADWYKRTSPADKEVVNALTSEYAEKGTLNFSTFTASKLYKAKSVQGKQQASALFFKFSEVIKVVGPQKDKFLAFAFCVNGGATNCK